MIHVSKQEVMISSHHHHIPAPPLWPLWIQCRNYLISPLLMSSDKTGGDRKEAFVEFVALSGLSNTDGNSVHETDHNPIHKLNSLHPTDVGMFQQVT